MSQQPAAAPTEPAPGVPPLGVLRRWWWVVVLAVLLGGLGGAGWAHAQEPVWESTTAVLVHPAGQDINVVGGRTQGQVNLDTEAQLVRSTAVATGAAEFLDSAVPPEELAKQVTVQVPPNTSVLMITFAGPTPEQAQTGARAFAEAYLDQRAQTAHADLAAQAAAISDKLAELTTALTEINEQLAAVPPDSAAAANLVSRRGTVTGQLDTLTGRLDELATATVTAGVVISAARLPAEPSRPQPAILLASGAALGLVLGVAGAGVAERLARRVHRANDLPRRLGIPVLAALDSTTAPGPTEIASPYGPGGRAFDRLRNEVLAGIHHGTGGWVIVVASPTGSGATGLTAANLAASIARSGQEVVLVGAEAAGGNLPRLLGVAGAPGLSEVLTGRVALAKALRRSPRHPRLRVLVLGATATAAGLLQSPALRTTLAALAGLAGYVVVAAPPTSESADTQSLAGHSDAALLVVEQHRTRLAELADAADQLHRVGTRLLGAVVVPPAPRPDPEPDEPDEPGDRRDRPEDRPATAPPEEPRPRPTPGRAPEPTVTEPSTMVIPRVVDDQPLATREPAG